MKRKPRWSTPRIWKWHQRHLSLSFTLILLHSPFRHTFRILYDMSLLELCAVGFPKFWHRDCIPRNIGSVLGIFILHVLPSLCLRLSFLLVCNHGYSFITGVDSSWLDVQVKRSQPAYCSEACSEGSVGANAVA